MVRSNRSLSTLWVTLFAALTLLSPAARSDEERVESELLREALRRQPAAADAPAAIVIRISEDFIRAHTTRDVDDTSPVDDVILDTHVRGQARTTAQVRVEFQSADQLAAFQIRVTGVSVSDTVGHNGPAVIFSRSTSTFECVKPVRFSQETGFVTARTQVNIITQVENRGVSASVGGLRGRIVRRVAAARVETSQPEVTAIVRQNAEQQIRETLDGKVDQLLAEWNERANVRRLTLKEMGLNLAFHTSTAGRHLTIVVAGSPQKLAQVQLPPMTAPNAPMEISIHRTMVGERLEAGLMNYMAGRNRWLMLVASIIPTDGTLALAEGNWPLNIAMEDRWLTIRPSEEILAPPVNVAQRPLLVR